MHSLPNRHSQSTFARLAVLESEAAKISEPQFLPSKSLLTADEH